MWLLYLKGMASHLFVRYVVEKLPLLFYASSETYCLGFRLFVVSNPTPFSISNSEIPQPHAFVQAE